VTLLGMPGAAQGPRLTVARAVIATLLLAPLPATSATLLVAQTIAITGGTVFPVSGPKIENGTVVIKDGRILAVGRSITIPDGSTRVDATGKWVTPGLFHASTQLGLTEVGSVDATNEGNRSGTINAAFNVAEGINPAVVNIPIARMGGVTTALTGPSGGLIAGQAVIIDLNGDHIESLVRKSPAAMVIDLSESSKGAGGGSRAGVLQLLRQTFTDAQEYERRKSDFRRNQIQPLAASAADLEALGPVLRGEIPVYAIANRKSDIESALRLSREFRLKLIISGGTEAWEVADELARAGIPVLVNPILDIPTFDGPASRFDNAALLRKAGVQVILVEAESGGPRNLRWAAGHAVEFGMGWDDALRAITLAPAEALGVADQYGSLDAGKLANVVVWSGDPLDFSSRAEKIYIRGVDVPMVSRQTELLDRYRTLPPSY
jgi:imidazolonepropionase-like amidohydrolase